MPGFFWSMLGSAKHWESFGMLQRHQFGTFRSQVRVSWLLTSREAWGSPIWIRKMSYNRISLKETRLHNKSHSAVQSLEMSSVKGSGKQKGLLSRFKIGENWSRPFNHKPFSALWTNSRILFFDSQKASVLNLLKMDLMDFLESCKDTVTVVESAEDKCMYKCFQNPPRHKSSHPGYIPKVIVGWLCDCLSRDC